MKPNQIKTVQDLNKFIVEYFKRKHQITIHFTHFPLKYMALHRMFYPKDKEMRSKLYGWHGWIEGRVLRGRTQIPLSFLFPKKIHTATFNNPGCPERSFSGEIYLFEDDFPSLKNAEFNWQEQTRKNNLMLRDYQKALKKLEGRHVKIRDSALFKLRKKEFYLYNRRKQLKTLLEDINLGISKLEQQVIDHTADLLNIEKKKLSDSFSFLVK